MLDKKLYGVYRDLREKNTLLSAKYAFSWAKSRLNTPDILSREEKAEFVRDGFNVVVELKSDDDYSDTSTYGEFESAGNLGDARQEIVWYGGKWWFRTEYSIDRRGDLYGFNDGDADSRAYFHDDNFTPDEEFKALRKRGLSKSVAWERTVKTMENAAEYLYKLYNNDIGFVGIIATASLDGEEYGEASCWGFDFEDWHTSGGYINDSANDLVNEAIYEAQKQLGKDRTALLKKCNETVEFVLAQADDSIVPYYEDEDVAKVGAALFNREWALLHPDTEEV